MAESYFQATNTLALATWIALVLFPGKQLISGVLCAVVVPALLAVTYVGIIGWKLAANGMPPGDVMTLTPSPNPEPGLVRTSWYSPFILRRSMA